LATILGRYKALGVIAVRVPGLPRVKEWADAGFFFVLTGAAASHLIAGLGTPVPALALLGLAIASWALRPQSRRLGSLLKVRDAEPTLTQSAGRE
jgi:hypothetical protein